MLIVAAVLGIYAWRASRLDIKQVERMRERSTVFDMDGKVWSRMQGENRVPVPLADVSPFFIASLLAREDTRFFSHPGVDPKGLVRAVVRTAQGQQQGGSTLTQQLARNSLEELGQRKSLDRKLLEAFVSLRVERNYTKEEILSHYMNRIYFGSGVYGIEMAAKVYFAKSASELSLRLLESLAPGASSLFSGIGASWSAQPFSVHRERGFYMHVNAEIIFYGGTHPDATVWIDGKEIKLSPDGTFRYHFKLPDGEYAIPIVAQSPDKVEKRTATLSFTRGTVRVGSVADTGQPPYLDPLIGRK